MFHKPLEHKLKKAREAATTSYFGVLSTPESTRLYNEVFYTLFGTYVERYKCCNVQICLQAVQISCRWWCLRGKAHWPRSIECSSKLICAKFPKFPYQLYETGKYGICIPERLFKNHLHTLKLCVVECIMGMARYT